MNKILHILPVVVGLCAGYPGAAQSIGLPEFVQDVIQSSPEVNEQVHIFRQAYQDEKVAVSGWLPSLDFSSQFGQVDERRPANSNYDSAEAELTLTQNLFKGFDTTNQINQAKARITSAVYRLYDTADNVALDAIITYMNVISASKLVKLAEKNVHSHEQTLDRLIEQNKAGIGLLSDLEQTRGRLASAKASLISQQNNLQDTLTTAHKLLGRYINPDELTAPALPPEPDTDINILIDQALQAHPALESAQHNIRAAKFDYQRSKRTDLPEVDLQLQQSTSNNQDSQTGRRRDSGVFLNLRYNLYRGGADLAEQRKKASEVNELEAFRKRVHRQVIDRLRLSWIADKALHEQLPLLEEHVSKSESTLGLYREEFLLNKRDLIDVLDSMNELNGAEKRLTETYYQALSARFRVYEGIGDLFEPLGLNISASETDIKIAGIQAMGIDKPDINLNYDDDSFDNNTDQCDNSLDSEDNSRFGCEHAPGLQFGYDASNAPPIAQDDVFYNTPGLTLDILRADILKNDSDPDRDDIKLTNYSKPLIGSLLEDTEGNLIYSAPGGVTGSDEFSYTITDDRGETATARVSIHITPEASASESAPSTVAEPVTKDTTEVSSEPHTTTPATPSSIALDLSTTRASALQAPSVEDSTPDETLGGLRAIEVVHFGYKKSALTTDSQSRLNRLLPLLARATTTNIEIRAHTDNVGSQEYNLPLSQQRAELVRQMLIDQGIDSGKIQAIGRGKLEPIADNNTEQGRAENRRVEIIFTVGNKNPSARKLDRLHFASKTFGITEYSRNLIASYVARLARFPDAGLLIKSYTDNVGSAEQNLGLSLQRANETKAVFVENGIPEHRIQAIGMGENTPIADNKTNKGRNKNRRAELYLQLNLE